MFNWMDLQQTMSAKDLDKRYSQTANIGLFVPERPKDLLTCDTEHTIVKLCQGPLLERPSRYWCLVSLCTKAYHTPVPSISNVSTTGRPAPRITRVLSRDLELPVSIPFYLPFRIGRAELAEYKATLESFRRSWRHTLATTEALVRTNVTDALIPE